MTVGVELVSVAYQDIMTSNIPPFTHWFCQDLGKKNILR